MSNAVFPVLPGLTWDVKMRPRFDTMVQTAKSGKELRAQFMAYPLWEFELAYEFLRQQTGFTELQTLVGFFLSRQGRFDSFLYNNPVDNAVTAQQFGVGDGATPAFQLTRAFGGFLEPVQNLNGTPSIFINDWEGNQLQYATPRTNLFLQGSAFDNASWTKTRATVSANATTSPRGDVAADTLIEDITASNSHFASQNVNINGGLPYSMWCYAKTGPGSKRWLVLNSDFNNVAFEQAFFDLSNGTVSQQAFGNSATITAGPNGFYKCAVSGVGRATVAANNQIMLASSGTGGGYSYTGDGTSGNYLFASQFEQSSVPTSYIDTFATTVSATDYALGSTGLVTFTQAPLLSALLTWTGNFYYRCRFMDDLAEYNNFLNQLWNAQKIAMQSVKL